SNEVPLQPGETAATNLPVVPTAKAKVRSLSSHLPPKLFCDDPILLPESFALIVVLCEPKPFAAGFANGRTPRSQLPVSRSVSCRHSNVILWFARMKQQDTRRFLVHMSRVKRQRPNRRKRNHREKGFAADVVARTAAAHFSRSRAEEH